MREATMPKIASKIEIIIIKAKKQQQKERKKRGESIYKSA